MTQTISEIKVQLSRVGATRADLESITGPLALHNARSARRIARLLRAVPDGSGIEPFAAVYGRPR